MSASEIKLYRIQNVYKDISPDSSNLVLKLFLKELSEFHKENDIIDLNDFETSVLIHLTIKCCAVFYSRVNYLDGYFQKRKSLKQLKNALKLYKKFVSSLYPQKTELLVYSIIEVIRVENYICYEALCEKLFVFYLKLTNKNLDIIYGLLDKIEEYIASQDTLKQALCIFKWFSDLVTCHDWPANENKLLMRFLNMHIASILNVDKNPNIIYLRAGLEICLKRIIRKLSQSNLLAIIQHVLTILVEEDFPDESMSYIAYCLELASKIYKAKSLIDDLDYETLRSILLLIASENKLKCILGNQTFHNIVDVNNNIEYLIKPSIFFNEITYNFKIKGLTAECKDWVFIKEYREELHVTFFAALLNHMDDIFIMQCLYTSMALLIIEIPTPYTTAFLVCLLMHIQNFILEHSAIQNDASHRAHALIISLLSLICWRMKAKILYKYVHSILSRRAYDAPFLNPPFQKVYKYANHYVVWKKPGFFFLDFEVRYALWKRFRLHEPTDDREFSYSKTQNTNTMFYFEG